MKRTITMAVALALATTPALARGGGGHASGFARGGGFHGYNNGAIGYRRGGAVFNARVGPRWGYGVAGGNAIPYIAGGAAIASTLLGLYRQRVVAPPPPIVEIPVAPPVELAQAPPPDQQVPFGQLSDAEILAVFGRNAEEQRKTLWSGAQAFCRVYPADRMCNAPQQGSPQ